MKQMVVFNSCWPTNIGNAFVAFGIMRQLELTVADRFAIRHVGALSPYLFHRAGSPGNSLSLLSGGSYEYVILGGMTQCVDYWEVNELFIRDALQTGARLVLIGAGAGLYSEQEAERVREFMRRYPVYAFVSRDRYSYELYHDLAEHAFDGIDSAFFLDSYSPIYEFDNFSPFLVATFDGLDVELILDDGRRLRPTRAEPATDVVGRATGVRARLGALRARHKPADQPLSGPLQIRIPLRGQRLILAHHSSWPEFTSPAYFAYPDTLVSDIPGDYLSLYSKASIVYSDRIHACIAALAFGNRAQLFGQDVPRLRLFERIGVPGIMASPARVDAARLRGLRQDQLAFLIETLK